MSSENNENRAAKGDVDHLADFLQRGAVALINQMRADGLTPLLVAVEGGSLQAVALLIKYGANVNAVDNSGATALTSAICLMKDGRDDEGEGGGGFKGKVDASKVDNEGMTALHWAVRLGSSDEIVDQLLQIPTLDIHQRNNRGHSCLHIAAQENHYLYLEKLKRAGCNLNTVDDDDATALHMAANHDRSIFITNLLQEGADPNAVDRYGNSPIHIAAEMGLESCIEALIVGGADVNATNAFANTPFDIATHEGHKAVQNILKSKGGKSGNPKFPSKVEREAHALKLLKRTKTTRPKLVK
eukprot:Ihof_evm3s50 gene=Ihof_evmTU3s50